MAVKPSKVLAVTVSNIQNQALWTTDDGTGNISTGKAYRWTVTLDIPTALVHSSHETRDPFKYDGLDIEVDDYIATSNDGKYVKIISITSQSAQACTCVVEDEDRLNTFQDNTGNADGSIPTVEGFLFEMRNGAPILYPLPPALLDVFPNIGAQIISRFLFRSKQGTQTVTQNSGGPFNVGDAVFVDNTGTWGKVDLQQSGQNFLGIVIETGSPGPNSFVVKTVGPIVEDITLPGDIGGFVYLDPATPGGLTSTPPVLYGNINAVFVKLDANRGILVSGSIGTASGASSKIYVVDTVTDRNNITNPSNGSIAYVKSTGGIQGANEWTMYIYVDNAWNEISNEDSALVDAGSAQVELTNFSASGITDLKIVSTTSRPFSVSVDVTTAFDAEASIKVGDASDDDRFMTVSESDLMEVGTYIVTPAFRYNTLTENTIKVTLENNNSPTTGTAKVLMSYV